LEIIRKILSEVDELIIVVGSAQYGFDKENPFTAGERLQMLRGMLDEAEISPHNYWLIPISDIGNNALWATHVTTICPLFTIVYSNNPLVQRLFKEKGFQVSGLDFIKREEYSSTQVRKLLKSKGSWEQAVPPAVAKILKELDAEERLYDLLTSDQGRN
jgi:nicotinamide-nucleotide adenylyltransferase